MSHHPERSQKNCLNCDTIVQGRFCHHCGQENIETKETFWAVAKDFVYDIFHFDSKFLETLKHLLFKPGTISKEYVQGKRARYLNPIRMYLFTSGAFFLIFFYILNAFNPANNNGTLTLSKQDRLNIANNMKAQLLAHPADTLLQKKISRVLDTSQQVRLEDVKDVIAPHIIFIHPKSKEYGSIAAYDSVQNKLPPGRRDSWFTRNTIRKSIEFNIKYSGYILEATRKFAETFLHKLPYLLFISLPFFAFILKLLYYRRTNFYYSDHAVFTLHHYIFSFLILLLIFVFDALHAQMHWGIFNIATPLLLVVWAVYLYWEMKVFYGQSWGRTVANFLLLNILGSVTLLILLIIFLLFSVFQM